MNYKVSILTAALLFYGTSSAIAASSTDLTVKGTITPRACTPSLSGSGEVDLGKQSAGRLNPDMPTPLDPQTLQLAVSCDAATQFAIAPLDNKAGSAWDGSADFGLGLINTNEKLGKFSVEPGNVVADTVTAQAISSTDGGQTWVKHGVGGEPWDRNSLWGTGAASDATTLIPVKDLTLDLKVSAEIAPSDGLDLSNEIPIDGFATLDIRYL